MNTQMAITSASTMSTESIAVWLVINLILGLAIAVLLYRYGFFKWLRFKFRRKKSEEVVDKGVDKGILDLGSKIERLPEDKEREYAGKVALLEERLRQMTERAKRLEEAYDELKSEYTKTKEEASKTKEELKKKDEEIEELLSESNKLVKWMAMRFRRGEYVPVVMWSKRGNPMVLKFVCGIAHINGGWRALLVDRLTDKPEKGQWYPALDKPGAEFIFRDQYGFNPDDPNHTVLFDINLRDWEEDLKVTRSDPESKPVAFMFGVDEDGQPVHRLEYGAPIDIRKLRSENRALKRQIGAFRYRLSKLEEELWDARYNLEVERDRREHLERENKLLKARMSEMEEAMAIQIDESEILRNYARMLKRREWASRKTLRDVEDEYISELITPRLRGVPGAEYLEHMSKEKVVQLYAKLAPIAYSEAKMYGIDTKGKSMEEVVTEWIKAKFDAEQKDLAAILEDYGLREEVSDLLRGSFT